MTMARLALSPVPGNGLVVLLMLLSGTAPPRPAGFSLSLCFHRFCLCSLQSPPVSHTVCPSARLPCRRGLSLWVPASPELRVCASGLLPLAGIRLS